MSGERHEVERQRQLLLDAQNRDFTREEVLYLKAGVKEHGVGSWQDILNDPMLVLVHRTPERLAAAEGAEGAEALAAELGGVAAALAFTPPTAISPVEMVGLAGDGGQLAGEIGTFGAVAGLPPRLTGLAPRVGSGAGAQLFICGSGLGSDKNGAL